MNEKDKYELCWEDPMYRSGNGGLPYISEFVQLAEIKAGERVVDFGCGEGRTLVPLKERGVQVILVDIANNCLAENIPRNSFLCHDLSQPLHLQADVGFCVDVMEHIPTYLVSDVLKNIFGVVKRCYFVVATKPDTFGEKIGETLHLTVQPYNWWKVEFSKFGEVTLLNSNPNNFRAMVNET